MIRIREFGGRMSIQVPLAAAARAAHRWLRRQPRVIPESRKRGRAPAVLGFLTIALLFGPGCSTPSESMAQDLNEYQQYVDEQLDLLCDYAECWWLDYLTSFYGSAETGGTASHYIDLEFGYEYLFVAVCDQDCTDVDLLLYDPAGALVTSDTSVNAYPDLTVANAEIYFEVEATGAYRLDVKIYGCQASTCYYGVDVGIW